jgi:hypothetical protein
MREKIAATEVGSNVLNGGRFISKHSIWNGIRKIGTVAYKKWEKDGVDELDKLKIVLYVKSILKILYFEFGQFEL